MKKKDLQLVAKELNSVLELEEEDQLDPKQSPTELEKELKTAVGPDPELDIYPEDEFSDKVWELLAELGNQTAIEKQQSGTEEKTENESEEEEEAEESSEEEEEENELDYEDARKQINQASKIKELKEIAEAVGFEDGLPKKFADAKKTLRAWLDEQIKEEEPEEEEESEEEEGPLPMTESNLDSLKKKDLLSFIESEHLDIDTEQSVKNMKKEIKESYELAPEPEIGEEKKEREKLEKSKAEKSEKKGKAKGSSGISRVWELVCENPEISKEDISKTLDNEGKTISIKTIERQRTVVVRILEYLKNIGKLKK